MPPTDFEQLPTVNDNVDYLVKNIILMIYSKGSEISDIPAIFSRDYKVSAWTASQASWFRDEGRHSSFEYVDESLTEHGEIEPWTVIDPVGPVYYFSDSVEQCHSAVLNGFAGWCDKKVPGQFDLGVDLALIKMSSD